MTDFITSIQDLLFGYEQVAISFGGLIVASLVMRAFIKYGLFKLIRLVITKQSSGLIQRMESYKLFGYATALAPFLVVYIGLKYVLTVDSSISGVLMKGTVIICVVLVLQFLNAVISFVINEFSRKMQVQSALLRTLQQVIKILLVALGLIIVISIGLNKSPVIILSSLGALTAVLLLVFKDSILGFVASIQVSLLGIVKEGDWIEMPKFNADGNILDINISSIRVQNWDKTITTIPTYALVAEPVKNWRGMETSKCRRIKRCLHIDIASVKYCSAELLGTLQRVNPIQDYIKEKNLSIQTHNAAQQNNDVKINTRGLTNIGVFREYINAYLAQHPNIASEATILVRQLQSTEVGVPIEVYCFTNITDWNAYEDIQSDIFDHLFAIMPLFELKAYQLPLKLG